MIDFSKIKSKKEVGKCFDYAILPKQTTEQTIRDCCKEAIKYNCKAFCFSSSYWTPIVAEELKGTDPGWSSDRIPIWTADKCSKSI